VSAGANTKPANPDIASLKQDTSSTRHLDGLRIVAASAVVILHYSDYLMDRPAGLFMVDHTRHFNLFVDLFFVISGFVMVHASEPLFGRRDAPRVFLLRRLRARSSRCPRGRKSSPWRRLRRSEATPRRLTGIDR